MKPTVEASLVALTLSGVERLRQSFAVATSPVLRQALLSGAADLLDRTVPAKDLAHELKAAAANPVPVLVANRSRIGAVPPVLWRPRRVTPNELGAEHYSGYRALERALRRDATGSEMAARQAVARWLAPSWAVFSELEAECLALWAATA